MQLSISPIGKNWLTLQQVFNERVCTFLSVNTGFWHQCLSKVKVLLCFRFIYKTTDDPQSTSLFCYDEDEANDHHRFKRDAGNVNE